MQHANAAQKCRFTVPVLSLMVLSLLVLSLLGLSLVAAPMSALAQDRPAQARTTRPEAPAVHSARGVVASDNEQASRVGARILAAGGNAADAGAAALLANGVLNPFASGLGGGGFCLYRPHNGGGGQNDAGRNDGGQNGGDRNDGGQNDGQVHVIDFRETAPSGATRDMFVVDGEPVRKLQLRGGKAVGVPGEPAGLWALQNRFGALAWPKVVDPALTLARDGYEVGPLLAKRLASRADSLEEHPEVAALFKKDGNFAEHGDTLERPGLARTLELYRDEGPIVFYHGAIGDALVRDVNAAGGVFRAEDLRTYSVQNRDPVEGTYRGHQIFSMPPPSSGGSTLVETLNILEGYELGEMGRGAESIHLVTEALKHAFADRARWLGDTDFVDVPIERLTSKEYAEELRAKIKPDGVLPLEAYGSHRQVPDDAGTTHVSIIDADGNMLACTSTINTSFGSMVLVDEYGLIMNNEMGDFTPMPGKPNNYGLIGTGQNAVAPGKRPLSSMSPTLVLRDNQPFLASGASGGPTIITGTLLSMINMIDFAMTPAQAIAAGRLHHQWRPEILFAEETIPGKDELGTMGHTIKVGPAFNSVQIVARHRDGTITGVSDPRKMGRPAAEPEALSSESDNAHPVPSEPNKTEPTEPQLQD